MTATDYTGREIHPGDLVILFDGDLDNWQEPTQCYVEVLDPPVLVDARRGTPVKAPAWSDTFVADPDDDATWADTWDAYAIAVFDRNRQGSIVDHFDRAVF